MSPDRSDPPPRIIIPGERPAPTGPLITPSSSEPAAGGGRLILPPGARETPDDLPEFPRLRPLEIMAVREGDRELLLVSDPLGVMPAPIALRLEAIEMLRVLNGGLSLSDLTAEIVRQSGDVRAGTYVKDFIGQLDRMLMLDSPRFEAAYRALREGYHALEIRQAALGGHAYPEDPVALAEFIDGHFAEAERLRAEAGEPVAAPDALPRALLAPHLDPRRSGATIARAHLELGPAQRGPLRVIVYGTGHSLLGDSVALTRKHFETPLGRVLCDTAFVDALAARIGESAWHGELAHRHEHSIEFETLYLKRRLGDRPFTLVPILCGGFHALMQGGLTPHEDPTFEALIAAVRDTERELGGATLHVAAVDLSHVGPRFGDPDVDERVVAEVRAADTTALEAARRGDAEAWYQAIASSEDATRICGWGATYALLRCAEPGEGRLLRYEPSAEEDSSVVGMAALVWP